MQALQTGFWSKPGPLATRARNPWRGHLENRHRRECLMSDQHGKVLSFGAFEPSIENRLPTNGAKVVPLGARAMDILIVLVEQANLQSECSNRRSLGRQAGRGQRSHRI